MKIEVCGGARCTLLGSLTILDQIEELVKNIPNKNIEIEVIKCKKQCENEKAPVVYIDGEPIYEATGQKVMTQIIERLNIA